MTVYVGTSGWQYRDWRGPFYPPRLPQRQWLPYYAERFQTVEVNNTFYRLPSRDTFASWVAATPADFVFVVKFSRFLTHVRRLKDPEEPVGRFLEHAEPLGSRLGPILLQLPPTFAVDLDRLDGALAAFPDHLRLAVEFRHRSWFTPEVRHLLIERRAALCLADRQSQMLTPAWRTTGWAFLRLHAGLGAPHPCYGRTSLESRARLLAEHWGPQDDLFVFFNNDTHACALRDARRFAAACRRHGLGPTRVPGPREVEVVTGG